MDQKISTVTWAFHKVCQWFSHFLKFFILILVKDHYTGNKSRNALVRQDFPHALDEQRREEEEAAAVQSVYHQMVQQQWVAFFFVWYFALS